MAKNKIKPLWFAQHSTNIFLLDRWFVCIENPSNYFA